MIRSALRLATALSPIALFIARPAVAQPVEAGAPPPEASEAEPAAPVAAPRPPDAPPAEPDAAPARIGYDKGFNLATADGKYTIKFTGRIESLFETISKAPATAGGDRTQSSDFQVERARLQLEGHLHSDAIGYKIQIDFGKGQTQLRDWFGEVKLSDKASVRFGQWKRPFSRQQLTSSGKLELVDRALTDAAFGAGRDIGVALKNDYEKSVPVEWTIGVFNGTGITPALTGTVTTDPDTGAGTITGGAFSNVPKNFHPAFVGRIGLNHGGIKGYSEADLEGGPLRWSAGASAYAEFDLDKDSKAPHRVEADALIKHQGLSASAAVYLGTEGTGFVDDQKTALFGAHAQLGYVVQRKYQAVARYGRVQAVGDGTAATQQEVVIGGNYFAYGHDGKLMVDLAFRQRATDGGLGDEIRVAAKAQLGF